MFSVLLPSNLALTRHYLFSFQSVNIGGKQVNVQVAPSSAGGTPGSKTLTLVQTPSGQQILTTPTGDAASAAAQGKMIMVQSTKPAATAATTSATTTAAAPVSSRSMTCFEYMGQSQIS